ncbi:nucleotidyltransferase domain-containing protein [Bacillus thuringiensis]|uniref:nucleotidyltransferase domain-containing protein n=1 Tax=Bacillus thuringiensis TaxID=1428 RepID=UPI0011A3D612|nr:nucleotidyltransferase family protein [Bacillus thuringiensis]
MYVQRSMYKQLSKEKQLVYLLAKTKLNKEEIFELKELLSTHLDWSKVIGLIQFHRIAGSAYSNIKTYINEIKGFKYPYFLKLITIMYKAQKQISLEQYKYILEICEILHANNIKYAVLKGIALAQCAYGDIGMRISNDFDILIHPNDTNQVLKILKEIGYVQGTYDYHKKEIVLANRREVVTLPLISHQTYPLVKKVDENHQFLEYFSVDVHFSVDLMTNNRTDKVVEDFLNRGKKVVIQGKEVCTLDREDMLIFTCMHFYKDAIYESEVLNYKDLLLYKICDIYRLIINDDDKEINWNEITQRVVKYKLQKPLYYALYYTNDLFEVIPEEILSAFEQQPKQYLNQIINKGSVVGQWEDNILDRVFNITRPQNWIK